RRRRPRARPRRRAGPDRFGCALFASGGPACVLTATRPIGRSVWHARRVARAGRLAVLVAVFSLVAPAACGSVPAPSAPPALLAARGVKLTRIGTFSSPTYVAQAPGDARRLFVVQQGGAIRVLRDGHLLRAPFLDITRRVKSGGEQGLLSIAFAPDYATSGRCYVDYTDVNGNTRVVEYRRSRSADRADPGSARLVLFQRQPEPNHNGGQLAFGPDGFLYVGLGDGGGEYDQHGPLAKAPIRGTLLANILLIVSLQDAANPELHDISLVEVVGMNRELYA